uniref:C-type lectin domain-containing protein n=1 Tax=Acrobeloides nanus TaxID=290746 RepID=A0A914CTS4_9BILA
MTPRGQFKYYWTGLVVDSTDYNDWDNPNNFQWTDGTALDFINWDSQAPHNPCTYLENYILDSTNVYYRWDSGSCRYGVFCDPNIDPNFNPIDFICAMSLT